MVAFYRSCLLAPSQEVAQVDEHGPYHDDDICTIAAHSFDVAIGLATYSMLEAHCPGPRQQLGTGAPDTDLVPVPQDQTIRPFPTD